MNAKQQYNELNARREAIADEMVIVSAPHVNPQGWHMMQGILYNLNAKIDAYGDTTYPLTEKQLALVTRILDEQEEYNKLFRISYDNREKKIRENEDRKVAEAMSRTPEQKRDDAIKNLVVFGDVGFSNSEDKPRETARWGKFLGEKDMWGDEKYESMGDIPAPTLAETLRILECVYTIEAMETAYAEGETARNRLHFAFYAIADKLSITTANAQIEALRDGNQTWLGVYRLLGGTR